MSDYIKRSDAINYIRGRYSDQLGYLKCTDVIDQINRVPSADVIDKVLESIENICDDFCTEELNCIPLITRVAEIREAVEMMKEGDQE